MILTRANLRIPERPDRLPMAMWSLYPWGLSFAGAVAASATRYPDVTALIDDDGVTSYGQLWARSGALAAALEAEHVGPGTTVGLLCQNHAGFVEWMLAAARVGADIVLINTSMASPQVEGVVTAERIDVLIHDEDLLDGAAMPAGVTMIVEGQRGGIIAASGGKRHVGHRPASRVVLLTSGTTGTPKGATRRQSGAVEGMAAMVGSIPLRSGDISMVAAPLFHGWGLAHLMVNLSLCSTTILHRHFEPERTMAAIAERGATVLVVVPVMLQRVLALGPDTLVRYQTSYLRVIASSGSSLSGALATRALNRFGPVVYNAYGSTEVAVATVAGPADLRAAPGTVGRPVRGARVRALDSDGSEVGPHQTGRIFVANAMRFDGYTSGESKETHGGMLDSGDLGHFDDQGRLFIDGRGDDMIVSGGENVYPIEVEELLATHPAIAEVAVVGLPDDEFGQALKSYVVRERDAKLSAAEVKAYVRSRLARYKVPRHVVFVDELPRTATGKLLHRTLA